jgi:SAM-dependent methyltransferase
VSDLVTTRPGRSARSLDGLPFDFLNTTVFDPSLRERLARRDVLMGLMADGSELPTTEAREGYFGDRHLEYWLSGHRDAERVADVTGFACNQVARVLDFGGATGRVVRHISHWCPAAELYLCDINAQHVATVQSLFQGRVRALRNHSVPSLPFPDRYFDLVIAFSVFTHIDSDDTGWLLELRRIIRAGGYLYFTIHDEHTWNLLEDLAGMNPAFAAPELLELRRNEPALQGKTVHYYNRLGEYDCNVFVSREHIQRFWAPMFASCEVASAVHDHQASVVFGVG